MRGSATILHVTTIPSYAKDNHPSLPCSFILNPRSLGLLTRLGRSHLPTTSLGQDAQATTRTKSVMLNSMFCNCLLACVVTSLLVATSFGEDKAPDKLELPPNQERLSLEIKIADEKGQPVAGAKVTPWALRWGSTHGGWDENDKFAGFGPTAVESDKDGLVTIEYPKFRIAEDKTPTIQVSIFVDHFDYAFVSDTHIDVPRDEPFPVRLREGASLEVAPSIRGKRTDLKNIHAIWSDYRSWQKESTPRPTENGRLQIPAMSRGQNTILLVKMEDETATHFSRITQFVADVEETLVLDIPLERTRRISGILSENVPRPIVNGRVKLNTLRPNREDSNRVGWRTWAAVEPDGSFTIEGWPRHEKFQVTALCDGYHARSGSAPKEVENAVTSSHLRPQVFNPTAASIEVAMMPMGKCVVTVVDQDDNPIADANVSSNPNVGWWNGGSQIYCHPLVRNERLLAQKDYKGSIEDGDYPVPFRGSTDKKGRATLELPGGNRRFRAFKKGYRSPDRQGVRTEVVQDELTELTIRLSQKETAE